MHLQTCTLQGAEELFCPRTILSADLRLEGWVCTQLCLTSRMSSTVFVFPLNPFVGDSQEIKIKGA